MLGSDYLTSSGGSDTISLLPHEPARRHAPTSPYSMESARGESNSIIRKRREDGLYYSPLNNDEDVNHNAYTVQHEVEEVESNARPRSAFFSMFGLCGDTKFRLVSRDNTHHFNIVRKGITNRNSAWFHSLLELSWWKLLLLLVFYYVIINMFFAFLYFADKDGVIGIEEFKSDNPEATFLSELYLCFSFSVQTISTIGYGTPLAPKSLYVHTVVVFEAFWGLVTTAGLSGAAFAKFARPTKISRQILFSTIATINQSTVHYTGNVDQNEYGSYQYGVYPVLTLRVANTRRSQLCDTQCRLLLLRRETEDGKSLLQIRRNKNTRLVERIYELDFEMTTQLGRVRGLNYSLPYLALPWTVTHIINEKSPLFGISPSQWNDPDNEFELIVVLDGVDEAVSMNVQARWSYLPSEIIWGAKFRNIIKRNRQRSVFEVDFSHFSTFDMVESPTNIKPNPQTNAPRPENGNGAGNGNGNGNGTGHRAGAGLDTGVNTGSPPYGVTYPSPHKQF